MLRQAVLMTMLMALPFGALAQEPEGFESASESSPEAEAAPGPAGGSEQAIAAIDRGLSAYWRRDWDGAQAQFQSALDADPQSAAATFYLGYAIYKQAEQRPFHPDKFHPGKERSKQMFARAFELDPAFTPTFQRSGR
jgi:tetratricopeptide (TPR) repeat protein